MYPSKFLLCWPWHFLHLTHLHIHFSLSFHHQAIYQYLLLIKSTPLLPTILAEEMYRNGIPICKSSFERWWNSDGVVDDGNERYFKIFKSPFLARMSSINNNNNSLCVCICVCVRERESYLAFTCNSKQNLAPGKSYFNSPFETFLTALI